VQTLTLLVQAS